MRIRWVKVWVDSLASLTERFRDEEGRVDFEALGREEYAFRHALVTGDFSRSERARDLYDATINEITSRSEAGRKGAEARWSKNTAAATTREGVDVVSDRESGRAVRTTGCATLTADASTREGEDERQHPSDGELLESGTSANIYDQETTTAGKLATGSSHPAPETGTVYGRPQDRPERACCMGDGTPEPQGGPKSGNHYDQEALDKAGAGEVTPESVSAPSPALPVPAKKAHGEFGNVMLTDDEFAKLQEKLPNVWELITELDQYIESQGKTKKYKSHYATLLNWSRRKAQEAKPQQRYKNINDINQENYEKAMREIEAMCAGEAV